MKFLIVNAAYSDFTDKLMSVIDEVAPIKELCVKTNSGLVVKWLNQSKKNKCSKYFNKSKLPN